MTISETGLQNPEAPAAGRAVVGRVTLHGGGAAGGATISVVARRLRSETALGETITGADGGYQFDYPAQSGPVDLVVRATVAGFAPGSGYETEVVRPDAGPREVVDIALPQPERTEDESLLADVQPMLDRVAL